MEKYSFLLSLYIKDNPKHLEQSINSMLNQTVMPDEIVIVQDGPLTEELENTIRKYELKHPEIIKTVICKKNNGLGRALNIGLNHCNNELVARMDADDISLLNRCEKQLKAFNEDSKLDILGGNIIEFINNEENVVGSRVVPSENSKINKYLRTRCPLNHMTVMFKKTKVIAAGNYQDWFWNEDYYLWVRMFEKNCKFGNLDDILVNVRVGQDMYRRRGGLKYFKSEVKLQKYMLDKGIIPPLLYLHNLIIRLVLQVIIPSWLRAFVFKKFLRKEYK